MAVVVVLVDVDEDVDADVVVCNVSKSHRAAEQKLVHKKESRKLANWLFTKGLDINFFSTSQNFRLWICLGAREIRSCPLLVVNGCQIGQFSIHQEL